MLRFAGSLVVALGLWAAGPAWAQQVQVKTLWNCRDSAGKTTLTDQKADTLGKECRVVSEERASVAPAPVRSLTGATTNATTRSPASFPRESSADRAHSRAKQRDTIEKELNQEQSMLGDARRKLLEQEAARGGDEKNYARVLDRLKPYQDTVEVHEKNVEALKRELGNLSR